LILGVNSSRIYLEFIADSLPHASIDASCRLAEGIPAPSSIEEV
jgi:hypothetical protein